MSSPYFNPPHVCKSFRFFWYLIASKQQIIKSTHQTKQDLSSFCGYIISVYKILSEMCSMESHFTPREQNLIGIKWVSCQYHQSKKHLLSLTIYPALCKKMWRYGRMFFFFKRLVFPVPLFWDYLVLWGTNTLEGSTGVHGIPATFPCFRSEHHPLVRSE